MNDIHRRRSRNDRQDRERLAAERQALRDVLASAAVDARHLGMVGTETDVYVVGWVYPHDRFAGMSSAFSFQSDHPATRHLAIQPEVVMTPQPGRTGLEPRSFFFTLDAARAFLSAGPPLDGVIIKIPAGRVPETGEQVTVYR